MTTPGGVPNLPTGALTIDNLASKTQDMTPTAMRSRAAERMPSTFDTSTGGNALNDLTPFGILTQLFAGFNSVVANADPADVQGPNDLPGLLIDFIESLPVIGELVGLLEAILGTYTGDDPVLLEVQTIFAPIRAIVDVITGVAGGADITNLTAFFQDIPLIGQLIGMFPGAAGGLTGLGGLGSIFGDLTGLLGNPSALGSGAPVLGSLGSIPILGPILGLFGGATTGTQASNFFTNLLSFLGSPTLTGSTGTFNPTDTATTFINEILNPTGLLASLTSIVDAIFQAVTGATRGNTDPLTDLQNVLRNIPFANVLGVGGPGNIGGSVQSTWDQLIGGLVGSAGIGAGLSDLFNISQEVSSKATLGQFSWDVLGIRSNKSINTGFLPTSESNIALDKVALGGSAPTFALTQSTAVTAYQRISEAASKGVVSWLGSGVTSLTDAFVNIYKMDTATGDSTLVHASANIIGSLSGSMQYNVYSLPTPISVLPGEVYGIEIAVRGAGTHNIAGSSTWLPDHPNVYPRRMSAVRNSGTSAAPATIATGALTYGTNVPFVEFGVTAGNVAIPHSPQTALFNVAGNAGFPVPSWANIVQIIAVPGGGGGHVGGTWGIGGAGGDSGVWAAFTWTRGTDFNATSSPILTVTVGSGGTGGGGSGGNGGDSSVTLPATSGFSAATLSTAGGVGANSFDIVGSDHVGAGPGDFTYDGITYIGGLAQNTYGAKGNGPGGGGAGGNWVSFQPGGAGAAGGVWVRFKQ